LSMSDVSRTGTDNQCFTYDWAGRLDEAWTQNTTTCAASPSGNIGGPAPYWHSYTYDKLGNRKTEIQHNIAGDSSKDIKRDYNYVGQGKPQAHALSTVTTTDASGTKTASYGYDETGNTTTRPGQDLIWDAEGRLSKVTEGSKTTEYLYDADGGRLIARSDAETTLYLGHTEVTLAKGSDTAKATRYVELGGGQTAIRNDDGTFAFTVGDHQGTGQLAIQARDLTLVQRRSLPFGGTRGTAPKTWPGSKGFVGGTDDSRTTGLTHLGAREYDPTIGRFISIDPLIEPTKPQSLNGYTYAENTPVTTSDPTGLSNSISYNARDCDGECQFKETHAAPDFASGQTWEDKYPWESQNYWYYDDRAPIDKCGLVCDVALDLQTEQTPTISSLSGMCGVDVSSGCDAEFRERVKGFYKEVTVLDDYWNCTFHNDETACDVAGAAFSSGGGTWAASAFFAFTHAAENRTAIGGSVAAKKLRNSPGMVTGGTLLPDVSAKWLRGSHGNAGRIPGQVARKLQGQEFKDFGAFRSAFWEAVADTPELASQFNAGNRALMKNGNAPKVSGLQKGANGSDTYQLHHAVPIQRGGGVYDLDNIVVVTPRYHDDVLDPSYHKGR
ncbi:RHS repeat-associated core domain-containing protein, partial [Streptomyces sp. CC219B]|uniref:RHS repeat domain-containing protein n=1 Tax=Streptomyces sp. CC219B TaxID=3044574 RepID=UPI0024A84374